MSPTSERCEPIVLVCVSLCQRVSDRKRNFNTNYEMTIEKKVKSCPVIFEEKLNI